MIIYIIFREHQIIPLLEYGGTKCDPPKPMRIRNPG
jgi:hypothetical protein